MHFQGYPSESLEGVYRNHMKDVQRFFTRRHPKAYKLYVCVHAMMGTAHDVWHAV